MPPDVSTPSGDLATSPDFAIGGLHVRPSRREVQGEGAPERIEPRVMRVLVVLAARPGQVLSRDALLDICWDGQVVGDDAINRCMAKLRRIGRAHAAFEIETVPRVGYRLAPGEPADKPPRSRRALRGGALAVFAIAGGALLGLSVWLSLGLGALTPKTPFTVQPFHAATPDPVTRAFVATADREITSAMSQARVATISPGAWRRRLVVDGLVDGDGAQVHARVRLTDSGSGVTLWTADFTAPAGQAASLRSQMAARVANVAQNAQEALACRSRDLDPAALALMIQSVDAVNNNTWGSMTAAEALVRRAPRFAPGHAMLASNLLAASVLAPQGADALRARAIGEMRAAIALRPDCPVTLTPRLWTLDATRWSEREQVVERGPAGAARSIAMASLLLQEGRLAEGRVLAAQVFDGQPNGPAMGSMVQTIQTAGYPDEAILLARRLLAVRPADASSRSALLSVMTLSGDPQATLRLLDDPTRRPPALAPEALEAYRAFVRWRAGGSALQRAEAASRILGAAKNGALRRSEAVLMLASLDAHDEAFAIADQFAADPRTRFSAMYFDTMFLFAPETVALRADARFILVAEKLGLLAHWRASGHRPDFCQTEAAPVCARLAQPESRGAS